MDWKGFVGWIGRGLWNKLAVFKFGMVWLIMMKPIQRQHKRHNTIQ